MYRSLPVNEIPVASVERNEIDHAKRLAKLLDSAITIPGTKYTFGLDALIGLIPGFGDVFGSAFSVYILYIAARAGVPAGQLVRMLGNTVIDQMIGTVPILGDVFDFAFKSNTRNAAIFSEALRKPERLKPRSNTEIYRIVGVMIGLLGLLLVSSLVIMVRFLERIFFS